MANLLSQYILSIFDDGTFTTVKIPTVETVKERKETPINNMIMDITEQSSYSSIPDSWDDPDQMEISIEPELKAESLNKIQLAGASARIKQMILVLHYTKKACEDDRSLDTDRAVTMAINKVAKMADVAYPTVSDKLTRQLNIKMPDLKRMIGNYLFRQDLTIKNVLLQNISSRTKSQDEKLIESWFQNPNAILMNGDRQI